MPDHAARIRLPTPEQAPGYRDSLVDRSRFVVEEVGDGEASVTPSEGAGQDLHYFACAQICDATTDLSFEQTWAALRNHPPRKRGMSDPIAFRNRTMALAEQEQHKNPTPQGNLSALVLAVFAAIEAGELVELLQANLPLLFEQFPRGSLWHVTVRDELLSRLTFGRAQLALQLTPDIPISPTMYQLPAFTELGLTGGVNMPELFSVPLLAMSPAALGFVIPAMPDALVFFFGSPADLRVVQPVSLAAAFRPRVMSAPAGSAVSSFIVGSDVEDGPRLLLWWIEQLNVLYSHCGDPTRFTDSDGFYDAAAQTAWMTTLERLLGDVLTLLAEPQASALQRAQIAFDLLDKAEALLGYHKDRSGKGFQTLLRRGQALPRLRAAFSGMPAPLADRFGGECERLFEGLYKTVLGNAVAHRRREAGIDVAKGTPTFPQIVSNDVYVARLCRAVRNSSHGLLDMLRSGEDRFLLATNTGAIPAELSTLSALIGLALMADARLLVDGSWQRRLVGGEVKR